MKPLRHRRFLMLLCATSLYTPGLAMAEAPDPANSALIARLERLEAEVTRLRSELGAARSEQAQAATGFASASILPQATAVPTALPLETEKRLAALETAKPADGFKIGNTTFKIGGHVRVNAAATRYNQGKIAVGGLGKEFYLPQQIPVGGGFASQDFLIHARQTRFVLNTATPVGDAVLKSHLEFDFALSTAPIGAQRATNPYVPTFRRGFLTLGNLLVGQEWTTFQNVAVLPESTDFVGPLEGTVFVRQGMVQYKLGLGAGLDLLLALENPETELIDNTSPVLADTDDDRLPDGVARLVAKTGFGEFSLAGIIRELRANDAGRSDSALGFGVSASGRVPFGSRHDFRFMATYGEGLGRYLGLGFAPDAVFARSPGARLERVGNFAGFAALKLGWTAQLRSTFMAGYQSANYHDSLVSPLANKSAWSGAANLFWTPVKNFDVGIEYRRGKRRLVNLQTGDMDRVEAAFKYTY